MHHPSLDQLLLSDTDLECARKQVQEMAYFKWLDCGCPENRACDFWNEAELEWIEYYYVPDRYQQVGLADST